METTRHGRGGWGGDILPFLMIGRGWQVKERRRGVWGTVARTKNVWSCVVGGWGLDVRRVGGVAEGMDGQRVGGGRGSSCRQDRRCAD